MESRQQQLSELRDFIKEVDKEVTTILHTLQWDKDFLVKADPMVTCKFDANHRIPLKKQKEHEDKCFLKSQGYNSFDVFLTEPLECNAKTVVKFSSYEIKQIIDSASKNDPLFRRGDGNVSSQPLTLDRLATTYTTDERRAIHDAVVNTIPSFHDLSDLALPSSGPSESKQKSRLQVLAELRDMRRRRTRYRVAVPANNYSYALRELIASQMELYTGSSTEIKIKKNDQESNKSWNETHRHEDKHPRNMDKYRESKVRESFKTREHFVRDNDKVSDRNGRYSDVKYERQQSSYSREKERRFSTDDRKRWDKYNYSRSEDQNYSSKDQTRQSNDRERPRNRDRKGERTEHRQYYNCNDHHKRLGGHAAKEKSRHRENR